MDKITCTSLQQRTLYPPRAQCERGSPTGPSNQVVARLGPTLSSNDGQPWDLGPAARGVAQGAALVLPESSRASAEPDERCSSKKV